jgi:hypothetical protein
VTPTFRLVAEASLAMPIGGHAGFAGVAVCFADEPSARLTEPLAFPDRLMIVRP